MYAELMCIVKALQSNEFVLQFHHSNDIRMLHDDREEII